MSDKVHILSILRGAEMEKLYRYNRKRGTLHIYGCCQYSNDSRFEQYDTQEEVEKAVGYPLELCKKCVRERDYVVKKEKFNRRRGF